MGKEHAIHLISVLKSSYKISADWKGKSYLGLDLDWDYEKREVHLSILSYVIDALRRFNHAIPRKPNDHPYSHIKPNYDAKEQYSEEEYASAPLRKDEKRFVQEVVGTFLYYA